MICALNIDTSRITSLVQGTPEGAAVLRVLQGPNAFLVVCKVRIVELARLPVQAKTEVVALLRDVPTLIGQSDDVLAEDELACACAHAAGLTRRPPEPFARDTATWGRSFNALGGRAADLLAHWDPTWSQNTAFRAAASQHISLAAAFGERAAVVQDPLIVVRLELQRHLAEHRARNLTYARGLDADMIIDRVGGVEAFPTFQVQAALLRARLPRRSPGEPNDLFDESIAQYHPYSAVSVLDRLTHDRYHASGLPGRDRVTHQLARVPDLVDRARNGDAIPKPFYLADALTDA